MTVAQSTITWMRPRNILGQPKTDTLVGSRIDRLNCLCKNISLYFCHYHTLSLYQRLSSLNYTSTQHTYYCS